jgi:hypothetical protein
MSSRIVQRLIEDGEVPVTKPHPAGHFTFKRGPRPTGLNAVAHPHPDSDILLNRMVVGHISHSRQDNMWAVRFMIEKPEHENCSWSWITMKARFEREEQARAWINEKESQIQQKFELHPMERY